MEQNQMKDIYSTKMIELLSLDNELDQFDYICLLALKAQPMPQEYKKEKNRIVSCDSKLWYWTGCVNGENVIYVDSDSLYVKGLAIIVVSCIQEGSQLISGIGDFLYEKKLADEKRRNSMKELEKRIRGLPLEDLAHVR